MMDKTRILKIGDIIIRDNILLNDSEHTIIDIQGNKAISKWYTFNKKVGILNRVFEYGKRYDNRALVPSFHLKD